MAVEAVSKTVGVVAETMRSQPLAIALILINLMFLFVTLRENERHDVLIQSLADRCLPKGEK